MKNTSGPAYATIAAVRNSRCGAVTVRTSTASTHSPAHGTTASSPATSPITPLMVNEPSKPATSTYGTAATSRINSATAAPMVTQANGRCVGGTSVTRRGTSANGHSRMPSTTSSPTASTSCSHDQTLPTECRLPRPSTSRNTALAV